MARRLLGQRAILSVASWAWPLQHFQSMVQCTVHHAPAGCRCSSSVMSLSQISCQGLGLSDRVSLAMVAVWVYAWSLSAVLQGVPMGSLISPVVRHMLQQQSRSATSIQGSSANLTALACSWLPAANMSRHRLPDQPLSNALVCRLWAPTADNNRDTLAQGLCSQQQLVQSPWVLPVVPTGQAQGMYCTAGGCHAPPHRPCSPSCAAEEGEGCEVKWWARAGLQWAGHNLPKQCSSLSQLLQPSVKNIAGACLTSLHGVCTDSPPGRQQAHLWLHTLPYVGHSCSALACSCSSLIVMSAQCEWEC